MAISKFYNVEHRNKSGNLKGYLTPYISGLNWSWNRIGGCGSCSLKLAREYRKVEFSAGDDIRIRIPGDGASCKLDGTGDYLSIVDHADFNFAGNNFKLELRVKFAALPANTQFMLFYAQATDSNNKFYIGIYNNGGNYESWIWDFVAGGDSIWVKETLTLSIGVWTHLVFQRTGNNWYTYQDDAQVGTEDVDASAVTNYASDVIIGYTPIVDAQATVVALNGWIDEYIVENNGARVLHLTFDEDFTDDSLTGHTVTANGNAQIDTTESDTSVVASKLIYRGWVTKVTPSLKVGQDISLDINGYFEYLKKIIVQDEGDVKEYVDMEVSEIVEDIVDTFITPNSSITKGTINVSEVTVDRLQFRCSVDEALNTLAELLGNIEYGVDEDLVFFWRTESNTLRKKFFVGVDVESFERKFDWSKLVNKIYFQGGDVDGVPLLRIAECEGSQDIYFLSEIVVQNGSIISDSTADIYLNALLKEKASPVLNIRFKIPNTELRLEDTIPIGTIGVYDPEYDAETYIVGEAGAGGSDLTVGLVEDGGSGAIVGSFYKGQVDKISYSLSNSEDRLNVDISLGDTMLETSAKIKQLELAISNLRQSQ